MIELLNNPYFVYGVMPLLIFCARIVDVTLGTMRIVFVSRGNKMVAPLLGFFEVFIWILAIGQIMGHANNLICYLGYAAGFAVGNFVGLLVEERLAVGTQVVRIISPQDGVRISQELSANGYGATRVEGHGSQGVVSLIYCVVNRKRIPHLLELIGKINPDTFYSIEDVRASSAGIFPHEERGMRFQFRFWRKGK